MGKPKRIGENLGAADVVTDAEYGQIEVELSNSTVHSDRTDEGIAKLRSL